MQRGGKRLRPRVEGSWMGLLKLVVEDLVACNGMIVLNQHDNLICSELTRFLHKEKAPRSRLIALATNDHCFLPLPANQQHTVRWRFLFACEIHELFANHNLVSSSS